MSSERKKKPSKRKPPARKKSAGLKLTPRQEKFCHAYMETGNASEAYRQAYSTERMKMETVNRTAFAVLRKPKIATRIQALQDELKEISDIKKERILYELEAILKAKITDYVEFDGVSVKFKAFSKLTEQQIRAVESIKQNEKGEIELKLHGKSWTTDRIMKMLGYEAPKKIDHTTDGEKINENKVIILPSNGRDNEAET